MSLYNPAWMHLYFLATGEEAWNNLTAVGVSTVISPLPTLHPLVFADLIRPLALWLCVHRNVIIPIEGLAMKRGKVMAPTR